MLTLRFDVASSPEPLLVAAKQITTVNKAAMERAVIQVLKHARQHSTGKLKESLEVSVKGRGRKILGWVGTKLFYGRILEFGAPNPWVIKAKTKPLRFEVGGQVLFRRSATHPPLAPRKWMRAALEESRAEIEEEFRRALQAALTPGGTGA